MNDLGGENPLPSYRSGGLRLHYECVGLGPPVVLIHGFTNSGLAWAPQLPALVHAGRSVVLPDLAGHGLSAAPPSAVGVTDLAADVIRLLDHLGLARVSLVGLSLGGMVAQAVAVAWPERVDALVVAASAARFDSPAEQAAVAAWVRLLEQPDGARKRLSAAWPRLAGPEFRASESGLAFYEAWWRLQGSVSGSGLARVARGMLGFNATADLATLDVPSLVLVGERDHLLPPPLSRRLAELLPGAQLQTVARAGHLVNLERPAAFNRQLLGFLERAID